MKNNFDDIVKKKWEEKQFPVDNAHRQDMIRLLDQQPRRRTAIFWWFGAAGIVISVASALLFLNMNDIPQQPVAPTEEIQKTVPSTTSQSSGEIASTEDISAKENQVASNSGNSRTNVNSSSSEAISSEKKSGQPVSNKTKAITNKSKGSQSTQASLIPVASIPSGAIVSSNAKVDDINNSTLSTVITSEEESAGNISENTTNNISTIPEQKLTSSEHALPVEVVVEERNSTQTFPVDDLLFISIPVDERLPDLNAAPVITKRHPVSLYAEATAGYVRAPTRLISAGSTLRAGAGLSYGLTSKLQISATGGYMLQKDGFEFQKTSTSSFPGFGARSNFHTLTPDKLHFVYARLGAHYRIHRHIFSLFGGTQYLYGAQGNIVIQTNEQLAGESETSSYAWLKLDGMQRWLWNGEATYGYQVTPRLSAHAGVRYYFSEISSDPVEGYYLEGKLSSASPFLTLNYHLYGKR